MGGKSLNFAQQLAKPKPASLIVYDYLLNAIVSGEVLEGQRIVESDLAKMFGVSRSPIREALKMLEIDGLIELIPYRGVVVTRITPKEVRESLEIKGMVEGFAAWSGAQKFNKDIIAQLEAILMELEKYIKNGKMQKVQEANIRFHHRMVENIHNERLLKYYEGVAKSIRRFYTISFTMSSGWKFSLSEHRAILNSIKKRDAAAAERHARQHAYNTIERVLSRLEKKNNVAVKSDG